MREPGADCTAPPDINAFVHRKARFNAVLDVFWFNDKNKEADRKAAEKFLNGWLALLDPMSNGEIYQNYPRLHTPGYASAYWGTAQAGLYAVKCKYDPAMAFRFAQDVKPLMPPGSGPGPVIVLPGFLQKALDQPITYSIPPVAA